MHCLSWCLFLLFPQMHFSIVTPVSMLLTDAFSHHDACFYYCFNASRRCIFLTWRLLQCFSEMHFPIMTPVSIIIRDAISYHDACFYHFHRCIFLSWRLFQWCSQMHFSMMTPVSIVFTDAFFYHVLGLILGYVLFCHCVVIDKGVLSGSVWLRQDGATSKGWLRTRALGNS